MISNIIPAEFRADNILSDILIISWQAVFEAEEYISWLNVCWAAKSAAKISLDILFKALEGQFSI